MRITRPTNIRTRLAIWFVAILSSILTIYIAVVFLFQYVQLERQIFHDEIQDVETVEGLLYFDPQGVLRLEEGYHTHPQSRLLEDRLMDVRDLSGNVIYSSDTLKGSTLGDSLLPGEGASSYNERSATLADGTRVLLISHLHPVQGRLVLIRLGYSMADLHDRMQHFFLILLLATPIALIAAGFAGSTIARRALRPLELMAARAEQITASNLHDRIVAENPDDELGHMARVLNHLLERLQQAFAQLQRFTADAAHELRTPLASIRSTGEVILQGERPAVAYRDAIGGMLEETIRLNQTIDGLLLLAKAEATQSDTPTTAFSLVELVHEILALLEVIIEDRHLIILEENSGCITEHLVGDRILIRVALLNVLHNAVKFSPERTTLRISYEPREHDGQNFYAVWIHDSGPGISPGEHLRVFERFFTGSTQRNAAYRGAGLGLSIAHLIITRNGGRIFFEEATVQGARCCIELPLAVSKGS
ncbi:MAG: integral rane sensor signal transduction histidine kinase [Acidobacteriaceae bacterium]|nr:integral rane sensor signal transduction histidine kinase [Acidobacteriaceae bacterium]